LRWRIEL